MPYYVCVPPINGRNEFYRLANELEIRGYGDGVEYYDGGWTDRGTDSVWPHLKFSEEADALAYALTWGGEVTRTLPYRKKENYT